jgi:hypothetical protein
MQLYGENILTLILWLYIWVYTLLEHLSSPSVFLVESWVANLFSFMCFPIMCLYVYSSLLWCPLWFPLKNDVRVIFTFSCLLEGSCLIVYSDVQHFDLSIVYVLCSVLWCPLRFPHNTTFDSSLPPVDCRRTRVLLCFCVGFHISVIGIRGGPCDIYHIPSENVPLKSEIFT